MKYLSLSIPGYGEIDPPPDIPTGGLNQGAPGTGYSTAENILQTGVEIFIIFLIILALFTIIWGGIDWIMSRGDKGKLEGARLKITWAILGLIVAFLAIFIVNIVGGFFGLNFFNFQDCVSAGLGTC